MIQGRQRIGDQNHGLDEERTTLCPSATPHASSWTRSVEEYVKAGHPNHNVWMFRPGEEAVAAFNELRANQIIKTCEIGRNPRWRLTDFGLRKLLQPEDRVDLGVGVQHHRDIIMGDKHSTTITGGIVGAIAVGQNSKAIGTVNVHQGPLTQEQHRAAIKEAQKALVDDEEQLGPLLHEVLGQFLRMARDIQVEQQSLAQAQARMKSTLDEVWAQQAARGLRPALPEGLKVVGELAKSPVMGEVVKALLGT
jgi:hypothetical protein